MKIAMFGTFDIANYGDILFPLVAEKMLSDRVPDLELRRYSYRPKTAASWHYDVRTIGQFREDIPDTDLILIGGGHLVHSNRFMAASYGPTEPTIPHPYGFWWLPAVAGRMAGVPVALHGVSVEDYQRWSEPLFRSFAESLDYANARDVRSMVRLKELGADEATVVPDSIFTVDRLVTRGQRTESYRRFLNDHSLTEPYIIVQPSRGLRHDAGAITKLLHRATALGWSILELPIFQEKQNRTGSYPHIAGVISAKYDPAPLLLTEIIANAQGSIGISLHLSIVSTVFGVPIYRTRYEDDSKYILLNEIGSGCQFLDTNPELTEPIAPDPAISRFQRKLDAHYDRLVELAQARGTGLRKARGFDMLAAVPEALRHRQHFGERLADERLRLRRARNFAAAWASVPVGGLISKFRLR